MQKEKRKNKNPYKKEKTYFYRDKYFIALIILLVLLFNNIIILLYHQEKEKDQLQKKIEQLEQKEHLKKQTDKVKYGDIIFLGDSITEYYDLEKYYNVPIVNSGVSGWTTDDILNNLDEKVYPYDAKKLFLLIGTNDIDRGKEDKYIVNNIKKIIKEIKKENKNVKIYIQSIYPINNEEEEKINHSIVNIRKNSTIQTINQELIRYCNSNNITYINMYDLLKDEKGNLKLEYTVEGLHISEEGYQIITKKVLEYL